MSGRSLLARTLPVPRTLPADDHGLRARLAWITGLRLVFLTLFLGAIAFFYLGGELSRYPFSMRVVLGAIGSAYAMGVLYGLVLRSGRRLLALAYAQIVLDQVLWTAIVYVSGGPTSGATAFYGLTVLTGAILVGPRGAAIAGATGVSLYGLLCFALELEWVRSPSDQAPYFGGFPALAYPLLLNGLGLVLVSLLGGYLADRLRITGGALREAERRADRAEHLAELGRISAWLAHEVRNPLGSISGSVELIREAPGLGEEDKRLCDIVQSEVKRLNELVGDMLDLAKPMTAEPKPVDVAALAREVVELANRGAPGVSVRYSGPDGPALALCDGAHMRQVLWNLVRNAMQATRSVQEEGSRSTPPPDEVDVVVEARVDTVDLAVIDRGPGIPDKLKPAVFDAFYTSRSQGAGIGLAVVKRIIDDHARFGASIRVADRPLRGTVFTVTLKPAAPHGAE